MPKMLHPAPESHLTGPKNSGTGSIFGYSTNLHPEEHPLVAGLELEHEDAASGARGHSLTTPSINQPRANFHNYIYDAQPHER
jgi:hypothetical protein